MPPAAVRSELAATLALPIMVEPTRGVGGMAPAMAFTMIAAAILLAPFSLLAAQAAQDPIAFLSAVHGPATALQLALALIVAVAFVALPARNILRRARLPRRIVVADGQVSALQADGATLAWVEPVSAYRGVAHHVRTSLSGARHEIVLVHADPAKSVVLQTADRIAQPQLDAMARLLGLAEVSARTMYAGNWFEAPELKAA